VQNKTNIRICLKLKALMEITSVRNLNWGTVAASGKDQLNTTRKIVLPSTQTPHTAITVHNCLWQFVPHCTTAPTVPGPPHCPGLTITSNHSTFCKTSLEGRSAWHRDPYLTTLTTDRHHATGGIRTRNPSKRRAAEPRLRPRGHWDRLDINVY
jgi:hypothetical protein